MRKTRCATQRLDTGHPRPSRPDERGKAVRFGSVKNVEKVSFAGVGRAMDERCPSEAGDRFRSIKARVTAVVKAVEAETGIGLGLAGIGSGQDVVTVTAVVKTARQDAGGLSLDAGVGFHAGDEIFAALVKRFGVHRIEKAARKP